MFVNWTVVCLLWDRCVCKLDCGVLAVGQTCVCVCVCELECGVLAVGQICL